MQRLGGAFWQAFSGSSSSSSHPISGVCGTSTTPREPAWDADKIRRVLEGTAVVRVVDVEPPSTAKNGKEVAKETKEVKEMVQQSQSQQQACAKICASARETGFCVLEESMRALTLGKK
jgi:hypothetical protein